VRVQGHCTDDVDLARRAVERASKRAAIMLCSDELLDGWWALALRVARVTGARVVKERVPLGPHQRRWARAIVALSEAYALLVAVEARDARFGRAAARVGAGTCPSSRRAP
jgi:hypothetical protein